MRPIAAAIPLLLAIACAHAAEAGLTLVDKSRCLHLRLHSDTDEFSLKYKQFTSLADALRKQGKSGYMVLGIYDEAKRTNADSLALCRYEYNNPSATITDQPDGFSCTKESHPAVAGLTFRTFGSYGAFASAFVCSTNCPGELTPSLYDTSSEYADHRDQIREDLALMRKSCWSKRKT